MRTAWLLAAVGTHLAVGYALGHVLAAVDGRVDPRLGLVGAGVPDLDLALSLGWPLVHRGLLHTPLFGGGLLLAAYARWRSRAPVLALGVGFLSHLVIDSLTPKGIMWLFPHPASYAVPVGAHGRTADALLLGASATAVYAARRATDG